ncbi:NRDE family protein [Desulfothermus naphthae]
MCIALIACNFFNDYPLIILSNRDEYHNRPTERAHFWKDYPDILAGKDLEQGGTWFGINKQNGKIGLLTNFREPGEERNKHSRGALVVNFLINNYLPEHYLSLLKKSKKNYNGYNLIFGTKEKLYYFNNVKSISLHLSKGVHVLSNGILNEPWPKCERLRELFLQLTRDCTTIPSVEKLFTILRDDTTFPDEKLPDTGVGIKLERFLCPIFIKDPKYGTRTSTVLLMKKNNWVSFIEITYLRGTDKINGYREFSFYID